jgi:hypothetical protein
MSDDELKAAIEAVLEQHPTLTSSGFGYGYEPKATLKPEWFQAHRGCLTDSCMPQVRASLEWLDANPCHSDRSSYSTKHLVESSPFAKQCNGYVGNGATIVAALILNRLGAVVGPNAIILRAVAADCPPRVKRVSHRRIA